MSTAPWDIERWDGVEVKHITPQSLRLRSQPGMKQVILKAGSGVAETDGAQQMLLHPSVGSKESRSLEVSKASFCTGSGRNMAEKSKEPVLDYRGPPITDGAIQVS